MEEALPADARRGVVAASQTRWCRPVPSWPSRFTARRLDAPGLEPGAIPLLTQIPCCQLRGSAVFGPADYLVGASSAPRFTLGSLLGALKCSRRIPFRTCARNQKSRFAEKTGKTMPIDGRASVPKRSSLVPSATPSDQEERPIKISLPIQRLSRRQSVAGSLCARRGVERPSYEALRRPPAQAPARRRWGRTALRTRSSELAARSTRLLAAPSAQRLALFRPRADQRLAFTGRRRSPSCRQSRRPGTEVEYVTPRTVPSRSWCAP